MRTYKNFTKFLFRRELRKSITLRTYLSSKYIHALTDNTCDKQVNTSYLKNFKICEIIFIFFCIKFTFYNLSSYYSQYFCYEFYDIIFARNSVTTKLVFTYSKNVRHTTFDGSFCAI